MARVPYDEGVPSVLPQARAPDNYLQIPTNPGEFGGGIAQGAQKLGAGATDAAKFFGEAAADDVSNNTQDAANKLLHGDPDKTKIGPDGTLQPDTGFFGLRGKAALDAAPQVQQELNDLFSQSRQGLATPEQTLQFDNFSRRYRMYLGGQIGEHLAQQTNDYYGEVNAASADLAQTHIRQNAGDDEEFNHGLADLTNAYVKQAQVMGGGDELIADAHARALRDATATRIEGLAPSDPTRALSLLQQTGTTLPGPLYDKLSARLQSQADAAQATVITRQIVSGALPPSGTAAAGPSIARGGSDVADRIIAAESGGNPTAQNPRSSAAGAGQFLDSTWLAIVRQHDPALAAGKSDSQILALKTDPGLARQMTAAYAADNKQALAAQGLPTDDGALYMAHFLGPASAAAVLRASPSTPVDNLLPAAAIVANPHIAGMTAQNMRDWTARQVGMGAPAAVPTDPEAPPSLDLAFGDSIAVQQIRHGVGGKEGQRNGEQAGATAVIGDTPQQVLGRINSTDPGAFAGKTLFLSPGTSNDPAQVGLVADEISALRAKGVKSIVIPGVGPGVPHQDQVNATLSNIAAAAGPGVVFFKPDVQWQADGIHPAEVVKLQGQARDALRAAAATGAPSAVPVAAIPGGNPMPGGFPTREDWIGRIPAGLSDQQYDRVYSQVNRSYNHLVQATSAERAQVAQSYKGGLAMLVDGREFAYDPARIKHLFPAAQAQEMIGNLEDSRTIGQQVVAVRGMSMTDIASQEAANSAALSRSAGVDYDRKKKLADAFDLAARQHLKALGADPAAYVGQTDPEVERARQALAAQSPEQAAQLRGAGQPDAAESYAATTLFEQDRLGVPADYRHVLGNDHARTLAAQIGADPEKAPATIQGLAQQWGSAWPQVWHDLTTVGKLPVAYQMVGALDDPADGALLARALGGTNKEGEAKPLEALLDKGAVGATRPSQAIRTRIAGSEAIADYGASMRASGASDPQIKGILDSITLLAQAKALYGNENPATAADQAVESAIGKWEFLPNGGARVPRANADAIGAAAGQRVAGLNLDQVAAPAIYATPRAPGQATADDWLRVLKANPNWVTVGQSIRLMDNGGRFVRARGGGFVEVPFGVAAPSAVPAAGLPDPALLLPDQ